MFDIDVWEQGLVEFNVNGSRNSTVIRVQQYDVTGKKFLNKKKLATAHVTSIAANGDVWRPTIAEVFVNMNFSTLVFKENSSVKSLWPGISFNSL